MPNRMLRDWTDSESVNNLSVNAERFFVRLIMKADDFGRYLADPHLLRSFLFPRLTDKIRLAEIAKYLVECQNFGLIELYTVEDKKYLQIKEFNQRLRTMKGKFPAPAPPIVCQVADTCRTDDSEAPTLVGLEGEEKIEEEAEEGREGAGARPPIPEEYLGIVVYDAEKTISENQAVFEAICMKTGHDPTSARDALRKYHLHLQEKEQYPKGKKAVIAGFEKWLMNEKKFSKNAGTSQSGNGATGKPGTSEKRVDRAKNW